LTNAFRYVIIILVFKKSNPESRSK